MKKLIFSSTLLFLACTTFGQINAIDFTANDCNGTSHNLFTELDAGKVVVIAWVMPCTSCITDPLAANTIVQGYATSNPGQVLFYLADDFANTSCVGLTAWANNYAMTGVTTFSDAALDMTDYGTIGMPKIVVLGGTNHNVYYNENSSSFGIKTAIDQALANAPVGVDEKLNTNVVLKTFPNPAKRVLNVNYILTETSVVSMDIINIIGSNTMHITNQQLNKAGTQNTQIDISSLSNGVYFLKINTTKEETTVKFVVSQ